MQDLKLSSWRIFFLMSEIMKSGAECVKQWHPNFSDPKMLERIFKAFVHWQEMLLVIWRRLGEMLDLTMRFPTSKAFFMTFPPKVSTLISGRSRSLQPVLDCEQSLFSSDLVRTMHARGSGEAANARNEGGSPRRKIFRASPVSRHQSRAWPLACLSFCSTDYRKKRDCS